MLITPIKPNTTAKPIPIKARIVKSDRPLKICVINTLAVMIQAPGHGMQPAAYDLQAPACHGI